VISREEVTDIKPDLGAAGKKERKETTYEET